MPQNKKNRPFSGQEKNGQKALRQSYSLSKWKSRFVPARPLSWAGLILVMLVLWFLSGLAGRKGPDSRQASGPTPPLNPPMTGSASRPAPPAQEPPPDTTNQSGGSFYVSTALSKAHLRQARLSLRGRTEADAKVNIKAQTAGIVKAIHHGKGTVVAKGTLLCRLEAGSRRAEIARAQAALALATQRFHASRRLHRKGHVSRTRLLTDKAERDRARAALVRARLDLAYTNITAPFRGFIEAQPAKPGDYLQVGSTCATLVKLDPLVIRANVPETDVGQLTPGQPARAHLITGQTVRGKLRYISAVADPQTRTFRIEIAVANRNYRLKDGVTATISLPLGQERAHFLPPSVLVLDERGQTGIRLIENGNIVRFRPVKILSNSRQGVWAGGLPERVEVITAGQDYVRHGQKVRVKKGPPLAGPPPHWAALETRGANRIQGANRVQGANRTQGTGRP